MLSFLIDKLFPKEDRDKKLDKLLDYLQKQEWDSFYNKISSLKNKKQNNILLSLASYQKQEFTKAQDTLKVLLKSPKDKPTAYLILGFLHDEQHAYELALKSFIAYMKHYPDHSDVEIFICEILIKLDKKDQAKQCLLKTLQSSNLDIDTNSRIIRYFFHLRDENNAINALQRYFLVNETLTAEDIGTLLSAVVKAGAYKIANQFFNLFYTQRYNKTGELPIFYGIAYQEKKLYDEALELFSMVLAQDPNNKHANNNSAICYTALKEYEKAIPFYKQAITSDPEDPLMYTNLAVAYSEMAEYDKAIKYNLESINIKPTIEAYSVLGQDYYRTREFDKAQEANQKGLALEPYSMHLNWNQSLLYLVQGDLIKGFFHYDRRYSPGNPRRMKLPLGGVPLWNDESLKDKTLYIYDEQGNGDTIVFVRFLPMIKKLANRVIFHSRAVLEPFFNSNKSFFEGIEIINRETNPKPNIRFDYQIPLMSIASRVNTTVENIPHKDKYLKASSEMINKWRELIPTLTDKKIKVALTWSGSSYFLYDHYRSIATDKIKYLLDQHPDIAFFAVTKGEVDESLSTTYQNYPLIQVAPYLDSFDDTAGLLHHVDLVISVDTAVAHLGSAMGKETWVLLYHFPFWLWGTTNKSPWYQNAKLYQQKKALKWDELLEDVSNDLNIFKNQKEGKII